MRATTLIGTKWKFSMIYTGLFPQRITPTDDYLLLSIVIHFMLQVGRSHHSWMLHTYSFSHYHYTPGFISLIFSSLTIYHSVGLVQHHHQRYQGHKQGNQGSQSMPGVIREALGRRQVLRFINVLCINSQIVMHELMQCWCVRFSVVKKWVVLKFYLWNLTWFSFKSASGFWITNIVLIKILASLVGNIVKCVKLPCQSKFLCKACTTSHNDSLVSLHTWHTTDSSHKNALQFYFT